MYESLENLDTLLKTTLKSLFDLSQHHAKASFSNKSKITKKPFFANLLKNNFLFCERSELNLAFYY